MKVYISGPVTGHEDRNLGAFLDAARRLAEAGYEPVLPHSVVPEDAGWPQALLASVHRVRRRGDAAWMGALPGSVRRARRVP